MLAKGKGEAVLVGAPSLLHIGQRPGDLIEIQGTEITYARVAHSDPENWHSGDILMDKVIRRNAGVEEGDSVTIEPARVEPASNVRVRYHPGAGEPRADGPPPEVRDFMRKRAIFVGDLIPIFSLSHTEPPSVEIKNVKPDAAGLITSDTTFTFD